MPLLFGLKVTLIAQLAPGAILVPQVFVWLNWPVTAMLLMVRVPVPVFVSVTVWALLVVKTTWVEKVRLVGESVTAGCVPAPVRATVCGLLAELSVVVSVAVRVPDSVGVNVTLVAQLAPAATELPQVFV